MNTAPTRGSFPLAAAMVVMVVGGGSWLLGHISTAGMYISSTESIYFSF